MLVQCEQGTPEWFDARCGSVTSSRIAAAAAKFALTKDGKPRKGTGDEPKARLHLKAEIIAETLTGIHSDHYVSPAMKFGTENEPYARGLYEATTGISVETVGFFTHPTLERCGASPDGLIGKDGLLEIKAPNSTTHIEYLLAGVVPEEYQPQMLWQMACSERSWCDFVSYDPRMPAKLQLFVVRFERDNERIELLEDSVIQFLSEVDALLQTLGAAQIPGLVTSCPAPEISKQVEEDMRDLQASWK